MTVHSGQVYNHIALPYEIIQLTGIFKKLFMEINPLKFIWIQTQGVIQT
ncbi:hypothetical protein SDC9_155824 [bioreactor metagenome]|uniref:Uncharacterized protein n=1 Tax=bioreactor metagenome TaxID=1076179 RepID=A0A645F2R2_9ZZZZ